MKEYLIYYNRHSMTGYQSDTETFQVGPAPRDTDGYLAHGHYATEDDARYAAYAFLEDIKTNWPELNKYPYGEPIIYEREVGEWSVHA